MLRLFKVHMAQFVGSRLQDVLHSGYIGEGKKVKQFEKAISEYIHCKNVLATNSCTSAITLALRLAGVKQNDYVLTTSMTCLATNEPILSLGAKPIWVDVEEETGNMCSLSLTKQLWKARDDFRKVSAILCVHWGGYPCDMHNISRISKEFNMPVIEDAAHAFGSLIGDDKIGRFSDFTCFSFGAIKSITCGDGGALVVKNSNDYNRGKLMRWFGLSRDFNADMRCNQDPPEFGYKFHMNDINATIGLANLQDIEGILRHTRANANEYNEAFSNLSRVKILNYIDNFTSSYWLYNLLVEDASDFICYMQNNEVECSKVHARNDKKTIFKESVTDRLLGVDYFDEHHVCIPVGHWLCERDVKHIIKTVKGY